jgi:AraC family transcriptional regulator
MQRGAFGGRLGRAFSLDNPATLTSRTGDGSRLAVTELRYDEADYGFSTPIAPEEAYLIGVQLRGMERHELWFDGHSATSAPFAGGTTCFYDLTTNPIAYCAGPFHSLHFYLPMRSLQEAAGELGIADVQALRYRIGEFVADPIILYLAQTLMPSLRAEREVNQTFVDHILLAMRSHLVLSYGGVRQLKQPVQYGLAPWQEKRAKELMAANLSEGVSLAELASSCGLSLSAFTRGFKRNTGVTPHQWLMSQRLQLAMKLMSDSHIALSEIAMVAGFADQSHFTRVFVAKIGLSPGTWRSGRGR